MTDQAGAPIKGAFIVVYTAEEMRYIHQKDVFALTPSEVTKWPRIAGDFLPAGARTDVEGRWCVGLRESKRYMGQAFIDGYRTASWLWDEPVVTATVVLVRGGP